MTTLLLAVALGAEAVGFLLPRIPSALPAGLLVGGLGALNFRARRDAARP